MAFPLWSFSLLRLQVVVVAIAVIVHRVVVVVC